MKYHLINIYHTNIADVFKNHFAKLKMLTHADPKDIIMIQTKRLLQMKETITMIIIPQMEARKDARVSHHPAS